MAKCLRAKRVEPVLPSSLRAGASGDSDELEEELEEDDELEAAVGAPGSPGKGKPPGDWGVGLGAGALADGVLGMSGTSPGFSPGNGKGLTADAGRTSDGAGVQGSFLVGLQGAVVTGGGGG